MNSTTLVPMIAILVLHTIFFLAGGHIIDTAHKSKENVGGVFVCVGIFYILAGTCLNLLVVAIYPSNKIVSDPLTNIIQFSLFVIGGKLLVGGVTKTLSGKSPVYWLFIPGLVLLSVGVFVYPGSSITQTPFVNQLWSQLSYLLSALGVGLIAQRMELGVGEIAGHRI